MKCTLTEENGYFGFDLEPETPQEIVRLVRFGLGRTKTLRSANVFFDRSGTASASIVIGKKQNAITHI